MFKQQRAVYKEKKKNDVLLASMLPSEIIHKVSGAAVDFFSLWNQH